MNTAESLYEKLKDIKAPMTTCRYTREWCEEKAPLIEEILQLKKDRDAVILAHSYVASDIIYGVADYVGDSYKLSKDAMASDCETIVFSSVQFMAETAKVLNPSKRVFMTSLNGGCTLADSIQDQDVLKLKEKYPQHTFICYINTHASIKALCDVCVTSSNVYTIVENYPNDKIVFLPDKLMGENIRETMKARGVKKEIIIWDGTCYVHQDYDEELIEVVRHEHPRVSVVSHPECSQQVCQRSDYVGSTSQIEKYVKETDSDAYLILTECGLGARMQSEMPEKIFVGACSLCQFMKSNSLEEIYHVLKEEDERYEVKVDEDVIKKARKCLDKMFFYAESNKDSR